MYLQQLTVQGFKSFAHKTTFLFSKGNSRSRGITAIVGPNGSGKSNAADAIRWVLGEQSMRTLRSKKSEDVIFFGSDTKAQLGFCEVSLYFNNEDHTFPIDYGEVVITRRLYRSGESEYLINGSSVRLADITLLLAQGNCGQRSYSVIGQGMIDLIVTMSPLERKSFFDEAAGVRQYQIKKDQALHKIRSAQEHLTSARLVVAELEPKVRLLERQIKRLEERRSLETRYRELLVAVHAYAWYQLSDRQHELETQVTAAQVLVERHGGVVAALEVDLKAYEKKHQRPSEERISALRSEIRALEQKRLAAQQALSLIDARLQLQHEQSGEMNLALLLKRKSDIEAEQSACQSEQTILQSRHTALIGEEISCRERIERCVSLIEECERDSALEPTRQLARDEITTRLKELKAVKDSFFSATTQHEFHHQATVLFAAIDALINDIEQAPTQGKSDTIGIHKKCEDARSEHKRLSGEHSEIRIALGIATHTLSGCQVKIQSLNEQKEHLERDYAYHSSSDAHSKQRQLAAERTHYEEIRAEVSAALVSVGNELDTLHDEARKANTDLVEFQRKTNEAQGILARHRQQATQLSLELAKVEAHHDELFEKICTDFSVDEDRRTSLRRGGMNLAELGLMREQDKAHDYGATQSELDKTRKKLEQIGMIDQEGIAEYESAKERHSFLSAQIADLTQSIDTLSKGSAELDEMMKERFAASLSAIEKKFQDYFSRLFNGGRAHLIPLAKEEEGDDEDAERTRDDEKSSGEPVLCGIDISAMPPGKKLKNMSVLSGGEKAMTAIALICAIVSTIKPPFVVLDEVDAALDESNASRFASIIQELGEQTQFIVITHNRVTIHTAQMLYGVTMSDEGSSRVLSLDIAQADDIVAQ